MSTSGKFDLFATAFPHDMVPDVIRLMLTEWRNVSPPTGNPLENRITNRFAGHLTNVMRNYDKPQFKFTCRPKLASAVSDSETGELDIQVTSHSPHPDAFLVVECKRLNVKTEFGFRSCAGEYVGDGGMGCFTSSQYESGGDVGAMLGYVMTRAVVDAVESIDSQLRSGHGELKMLAPFELSESTLLPDCSEVKETNHRLSTNPCFVIVHAFVHFSALKA